MKTFTTNNKTYQDVTGPLMASGYQKNGTQEAMNGMYITAETYHLQTETEKSVTLKARDYKDPQVVYMGSRADDEKESEESMSTVRRLTPVECERLQGFPDGWTDIGEWKDSKGKKRETVDSARYKALGNSIALPYWFRLLRRISALYDRPATLGSLFDGIGGFPLCWERCNGEGTALWASEIEEFPIAVTKRHFPERGDAE